MRNINLKKLILFVGYGIVTFYDEPKYEDFCEEEFIYKPLPLMEPRDGEVFDSDAYEEQQRARKECNDAYQTASDLYKRNVFIVWVVAGSISIVVGFFVGQSEAVSLGLSFGGLVSLIVGAIGYWSAMNDYLRFIILGIALAVLIWIGIKRFRNNIDAAI